MKKGQVLFNHDGVQVALFPMEALRVSQKAGGTYSHKGSMAIDMVGKNSRIEDLLAFADCKLVWKQRDGMTNSILFQSNKKVLCADGDIDYVRLLIIHDNDIHDVSVNQEFKQGSVIAQEGGFGKNGAKTYGIHSHINAGKGKFDGKNVAVKNSDGVWELFNESKIEDIFFINDTEVIKPEGMVFKKFEEDENEIYVNDFVRIIGYHYATGELIPKWVKKVAHRVTKVNKDKVLLNGDFHFINSWVLKKDVVKVK